LPLGAGRDPPDLQPVTHQRGAKPFSGEAFVDRRAAFLSPAAPRAAGPAGPATGSIGGGEARLRGQVQPASPVASQPTCWSRRRWRHPLAVPILLGAVAEPVLPENDATVADGAVGGDGRGLLLLGDPDGDAGGDSLVAEHHVRV